MNPNDFISFEQASEIVGINKDTLGRIQSGYLSPYIHNKQFNIKLYLDKKKEIDDKRHTAHCLYYACNDIYEDDLELSKWLSRLCGRSKQQWLNFLDIDLFSLDKNNIILSWYEREMITTVQEELRQMHEEGFIDLEWYFY